MITVNTNMASLIAQNSFNRASISMNNALNRLSTGYRINSAKDDAAGCAIASAMDYKLRSYDVAQDNAQMGIAVLDTATGAIDTMKSMLQRMRDLTVQAANGTYGAQECQVMQAEVNALASEISRIKNTTEVNGKLIFGSGNVTSVQPVDDSASSIVANSPYRRIAPKSVEELNAQYGEGNWIEINSSEDLSNIPKNGESVGNIYVLTSDIDLSGIDWTPIGYGSGYSGVDKAFQGTFDGNGYIISNLTVNQPSKVSVGLFGGINNTTVKNLTLKNVNLTGSENIGGVTGLAVRSTIENCYVSGSINGTYTGTGRNNGFVGGLVGVMSFDVNVTNCGTDVDINAGKNTGGIVGHAYSNSKITNSYALGDITGNTASTAWVGGLIGFGQTGITVSNSYATGSISAVDCVGGIVGHNEGVTVNNSYFVGEVPASATNAGLLSGDGSSVANNSYAIGDVKMGMNCTNCFGTRAETGVTVQSEDWFSNSSNLDFLGNAYNYSFNPPQIIGNLVPVDIPPTPPVPEPESNNDSTKINLQVGIDASENSVISIDCRLDIPDLDFDLSTQEKSLESLTLIDNIMDKLTFKSLEIASVQNRLESVLEFQSVQMRALTSATSLIKDADIARESANYVKNQILQQTTASLLATANQNPNIALNLL